MKICGVVSSCHSRLCWYRRSQRNGRARILTVVAVVHGKQLKRLNPEVEVSSEATLRDACVNKSPTTVLYGTQRSDVVQALQLYLNTTEAEKLLLRHPGIVQAQAVSLLQFLEAYGFSKEQVRHVIALAPELFVTGSVATAGRAILHLRRLGFTNDSIIHQVVPYCPQILSHKEETISTVIGLWSKF